MNDSRSSQPAEHIDPQSLAEQLVATYGNDTDRLLEGVMHTPAIRIGEAFRTLNLLSEMVGLSAAALTAKKREIIEHAYRSPMEARRRHNSSIGKRAIGLRYLHH